MADLSNPQESFNGGAAGDGGDRIAAEVKAEIFRVIGSVGRLADYVFVGDGGHTRPAILNFLSGDNLMRSLALAGCEHVCLEQGKHLQDLFDQLFDEEIDGVEFKKRITDTGLKLANDGEVTLDESLEAIVKRIDFARSHGMNIHAVDDSKSDGEQVEARVNSQLAEMSEEIARLNLETAEHNFRRTLINYLPGPLGQMDLDNFTFSIPNLWQCFLDHKNDFSSDVVTFMEGQKRTYDGEVNALNEAVSKAREAFKRKFLTRLSADGRLADIVRDETNNEKVALIYGAGHQQIISELAGKNGENKVFAIHAYENHAAMVNCFELVANQMTSMSMQQGTPPDMVYLIEEDKVLITQCGMKQMWIMDALKEQGVEVVLEKSSPEVMVQSSLDVLEAAPV